MTNSPENSLSQEPMSGSSATEKHGPISNRDLLAKALALAQGEMKNAVMNRRNDYFKSRYATLGSIWDAVRAALPKHGLSVTQATEIRGGDIVLVTTLLHESGQFITSEFPIIFSGKPQDMGSQLTYTKRYQLSAIVGMAADEDDDGNEAEETVKHDRKPIAPKPDVMKADPISSGPMTFNAPFPLMIPTKADESGPDWVAFGKNLISAVKASRTPQEGEGWRENNRDALSQMESDAPKMFTNLSVSIIKAIKDLEKGEANAG